jgi:hypothetical protein
MSDTTPATEEAKTTLENSVTWYLNDKLGDPGATIVTKKYLTSDNMLVYLTKCNVAELAVPRIKVQVLQRVENGVHETGYQLFGDHRLEKYDNDMIFGAPGGADSSQSTPVSQSEAEQLLKLVTSLQTARQTL